GIRDWSVTGVQTCALPISTLQCFDLIAQPRAHAGVKRGERLVEQQQRRRARERASQRHTLLLPSRQLSRVLGALIRQADEIQQRSEERRVGRERRERVAEV